MDLGVEVTDIDEIHLSELGLYSLKTNKGLWYHMQRYSVERKKFFIYAADINPIELSDVVYIIRDSDLDQILDRIIEGDSE